MVLVDKKKYHNEHCYRAKLVLSVIWHAEEEKEVVFFYSCELQKAPRRSDRLACR